MVALVIRDRSTCKRSNKTIHFAMVIALLLQRRLHIGDDLIWRQIVVTVDRSVPGIIRVRIVAPRREPVTRVPIIWGAENEHDPVVMAVPPTLVMPLCPVIPKNRITLALPVLASLDASTLLEVHARGLCRVWLFCKIKMPRLERLACIRHFGRSLCFADFRRLGCHRSFYRVRLAWFRSFV